MKAVNSDEVERVLTKALHRAASRRQLTCDALQLLEILLEDRGETELSSIVTRRLRQRVSLPFEPSSAELDAEIELSILPAAGRSALTERLRPSDILNALLSTGSPIEPELREYIRVRLRQTCRTSDATATPEHSPEDLGVRTTNEQAVKTSALTSFVPELHDWHVERADCTDNVIMTLLHDSALLVGQEGSGRRTLISLAVKKLMSLVEARRLPAMSFWQLNPIQLISGTSFRGDLELKVERLLGSLPTSEELPVVIVRDVHLLVGNRGESSPDIASLLLPALEAKRIRLLAHATPDWCRERLEQHPAFLQQFRITRVEAADVKLSERLLARQSERIAKTYGVTLGEGEVRKAIDLAYRLLPQEALPGAAVALISDAAGQLSFESNMADHDSSRMESAYWKHVGEESRSDARGALSLSSNHLLVSLATRRGIPFDHLDSSAERTASTFAEKFSKHLFGQAHVQEQLTKSVRVALAGLSDQRRPRAQLLFVGPPGTGKTESARLIAEHLMGDADALLRYDMSEFADKASISTLLGSDKGLVGSEEGGRLTEPVRQQPHRVILFDEIEKADRAIFNLFLQILDYGFISDKQGHRVSFRHSILIFTSNAGCQDEGELHTLSRRELSARLQKYFSAEFLDRMDRLIPFHPLNRRARLLAANAQLNNLRNQLLQTHRAELLWNKWVLAAGARAAQGEPGARQIHRWIGDQVKPALASALLSSNDPSDKRLFQLSRSGQTTVSVTTGRTDHEL